MTSNAENQLRGVVSGGGLASGGVYTKNKVREEKLTKSAWSMSLYSSSSRDRACGSSTILYGGANACFHIACIINLSSRAVVSI